RVAIGQVAGFRVAADVTDQDDFVYPTGHNVLLCMEGKMYPRGKCTDPWISGQGAWTGHAFGLPPGRNGRQFTGSKPAARAFLQPADGRSLHALLPPTVLVGRRPASPIRQHSAGANSGRLPPHGVRTTAHASSGNRPAGQTPLAPHRDTLR